VEERNGLWHASNSVLMPPTLEGPTKHNLGPSSSPRINKFTAPAQTTNQPNNTASPDMTPDDDVDGEQFYQAQPTSTTDVSTNDISVQNMGVFGDNMSKALKQLEPWHQGTGHLAPQTLRRTQQCVNGMPPSPDALPLFQCKFCDMAKQCKSNRGPRISSENFKPGTACHMDVGFIRGPDNLPDMIADGATLGNHVMQGRRGEECYLLIIDAASREMWTFPFKNKNLPIALIDSFLQKNGTGGKKNLITTSPDGMLARSNRFQQTCESNGHEIDSHEMEVDFECIRGDAPLAVGFDGGGEFDNPGTRRVITSVLMICINC
jgi:hypothetical protein